MVCKSRQQKNGTKVTGKNKGKGKKVRWASALFYWLYQKGKCVTVRELRQTDRCVWLCESHE